MSKVIDLIIGRHECPPPRLSEEEKQTSWSPTLWAEVLQEHVSDTGRVSYDTLQLDQRFLQVVEVISRCSPQSHPDLFPNRDSKLSFWINTYNILTLWGVVASDIHQSVQDLNVSTWLRVNAGQDFFVALRFLVGGTWMSLYHLENTIIRGFGDGRIHAAINCASNGCPILNSEPYQSETLNDMLTDSMRLMVNSPQHLSVSRSDQCVYASQIFKWYLKDFEARRKTDLFQYWLKYAGTDLSAELQHAQSNRYPIRWMDYDWTLNSV
jgi:hypothetical protein